MIEATLTSPADSDPMLKNALPRKPKRSNGKATYEKLLDELEQTLLRSDGVSIRLKDLAAATGTPVASVYHFFPSPDAAAAGLAERYVEKLGTMLSLSEGQASISTWQDLVREAAKRGRAFYAAHPTAFKLLLGTNQSPGVRKIVLDSYWGLANLMVPELRRLIDIPEKLDLTNKLAHSIVISDAFWALSYALHGKITDALAQEGERAVTAYLQHALEESS